MPEQPATIARFLVVLLRERSKAMGLTQAEVAARAGISQPRVSRIFAHGVALTFEAALALCDALDIGLEEAYREALASARNQRQPNG